MRAWIITLVESALFSTFLYPKIAELCNFCAQQCTMVAFVYVKNAECLKFSENLPHSNALLVFVVHGRCTLRVYHVRQQRTLQRQWLILVQNAQHLYTTCVLKTQHVQCALKVCSQVHSAHEVYTSVHPLVHMHTGIQCTYGVYYQWTLRGTFYVRCTKLVH